MMNAEKILLDAGYIKTSPIRKGSQDIWYIKVLLGFSAWLAAFFLLGAIGAFFVDIFDDSMSCLVTSFVLLGCAYFLFKKQGNEFTINFAFAVSLAGQILAVFGMIIMTGSGLRYIDKVLSAPSFWASTVVLFVFIAVIMPNYTHRVLTSFAAMFSLYCFLWSIDLPYIAFPSLLAVTLLLWLSEFYWGKHIEIAHAFGYGCLFSLFLISQLPPNRFFIFFQEYSYSLRTINHFFLIYNSLLMVLAFTGLMYLLKKQSVGLPPVTKIALVVIALIVCFFSIRIPGVIIAILFLLIAFAHSNKVLFALNIMYLFVSISAYYYQLETTLLMKSAIFAIFGVIVLSARLLWIKLFPYSGDAQ